MLLYSQVFSVIEERGNLRKREKIYLYLRNGFLRKIQPGRCGDRIIFVAMTTSGHCIVCPSIYGF